MNISIILDFDFVCWILSKKSQTMKYESLVFQKRRQWSVPLHVEKRMVRFQLTAYLWLSSWFVAFSVFPLASISPGPVSFLESFRLRRSYMPASASSERAVAVETEPRPTANGAVPLRRGGASGPVQTYLPVMECVGKSMTSAISMESLNSVSTDSTSNSNSVRTLFVSGLPMDAKPRELYLLFRAYRGYESSLLKMTAKGGKPTSPVGFVTFVTRQDADEARKQLQGVRFDPDCAQVCLFPKIFTRYLQKYNFWWLFIDLFVTLKIPHLKFFRSRASFPASNPHFSGVFDFKILLFKYIYKKVLCALRKLLNDFFNVTKS